MSRNPSWEDIVRDLRALLDGLEPYLGQIVLCGGWAVFLYRALPESSTPGHRPLLTQDFDWVVPERFVPTGLDLDACLHRAGFVSILTASVGSEVPVTRYQHQRWGSEELAPIHVELLVPLVGSPRSRDGTTKDVVRLAGHGGATAQALRYLDLLLDEPLSVDVGVMRELGLPQGTIIRIPHPARYVVQKALALPSRAKKSKDFAYLYEAAMCTRPMWPAIGASITALGEQDPTRAKWLSRARAALTRWFTEEASAGPVGATRVIRAVKGREGTTETEVLRVMRAFLDAVGLLE